MTSVRTLMAMLAVLLLGMAAPLPAQAADAQAAKAMVRSAVDDGLKTVMTRDQSLPERARLLDGLLRRYTDPAMLAARILGHTWDRISPQEQAAFTDTFMRYLVSSYVGLLKNVSPDVKVEMGDAVDLGAGALVASLARLPSDPGGPIPVTWEIATAADGRLVLMDVTADGISIIRAMHDDFASVLRSSGGRMAPLMAALQRKIESNEKDNLAGR